MGSLTTIEVKALDHKYGQKIESEKKHVTKRNFTTIVYSFRSNTIKSRITKSLLKKNTLKIILLLINKIDYYICNLINKLYHVGDILQYKLSVNVCTIIMTASLIFQLILRSLFRF